MIEYCVSVGELKDAIYEFAYDTDDALCCPASIDVPIHGWFCQRIDEHSGPHEAHYHPDKAVALWYTDSGEI